MMKKRKSKGIPSGFGKSRVISPAFQGKGLPDVVLIDALPIKDAERLRISFESISSPHRQGIWLWTNKGMTVNGQRCPSVELWSDTAPRNVMCTCHTTDGILTLYNIWDEGQGRQSQAETSGMLVEEFPDGYRYACNDYGYETKFDKLIFRIQRVN